MAKIKYIIKDPSFKYFMIGLVLFVAITSGGIITIKKLVTKNAPQEDVAVVDKSSKPDNVVTIDNSPKPSPKPAETTPPASSETSAPNANTTTPAEISRTGGNGLATAVGLSVVAYVAVLILQKR